MPKNKLVVSSRVDPRTLGNVSKYLTENGMQPNSQSDLIYKGLLVLSQSLIEQELIEPVLSDKKAISYMTGIDITWNKNAKSREKIEKIMQVTPTLHEKNKQSAKVTPRAPDKDELKEYMDEIATRMKT